MESPTSADYDITTFGWETGGLKLSNKYLVNNCHLTYNEISRKEGIIPCSSFKILPTRKILITDNTKSTTKGRGMLEVASFAKA